MNENLLQLAKQAGLKKDHASDQEYIGDFDWRLFADLLINECIAVIQPTQYHRAYPENHLGGADGLELIDRQVKKIETHFGVNSSPSGWVCPKCGVDRLKAACPNGDTAATTGVCPMVGEAQ